MNTDSPHLRVHATAEESADACAAYVLESLADSLKARPLATIAISGGNTPKLLFRRLAQADFDWAKVHFFWVDERCVPPTDNESNVRMATETLLKPARIRESNIHRVQGELPPKEAAKQYVQDIQRFFSLTDGQLPSFDVLHRGMGADAHTASLFPGEPLIQNDSDVAAAVWVAKLKMYRVTLLPGVLRAAKRTVLQVSGTDKAEAVREVLTGGEDLLSYPCQIASRNEKATWFLDDAAAERL